MIVPPRAIPALALLVALVTLVIVFDVGIARSPSSLLGEEDIVVIGPPEGQSPGRAEVPARFVGPMRALPFVDAVSPEVFAVIELDGRSTVVRGADVEQFLRIESARLIEGRLPRAPGEALVGTGFARVHDIVLDDTLLLPSPLARTAATVRIVGIFESSRASQDELVVGMDDGRSLAGVSPEHAHLVRVRTTDPRALGAILRSFEPTFTYSDVALSSQGVLAFEPLVLRANLTNWGALTGSKLVQVMSDGSVVAEEVVTVPARSTVAIEVPFALPRAGTANVTLNPSFTVDVREARASIEATDPRAVGQPLNVLVRDPSGAPADAVIVSLGDARARTDAAGRATLVPTASGDALLRAERAGETLAVIPIFIADPTDGVGAVAKVEGIELPVEPLGRESPITLGIRLRNVGGAHGVVRAPVTIGDAVVGEVALSLPAGGRGTATVTVAAQPPGSHEVRAGAALAKLRIYGGDDPRIEQLLEGYEAARRAPPPVAPRPDAQPADYVDELLGNVRAATILLGVASAALATMGIVAVLSRHLAERAPTLGTLRALGASTDAILTKAAIEAAWVGVAASLLGMALAVALGAWIDGSGIVWAFGHAIHPVYAPRMVGLILLGSVAFIVLCAVLLVRALLARPVAALLRGEVARPLGLPPNDAPKPSGPTH